MAHVKASILAGQVELTLGARQRQIPLAKRSAATIQVQEIVRIRRYLVQCDALLLVGLVQVALHDGIGLGLDKGHSIDAQQRKDTGATGQGEIGIGDWCRRICRHPCILLAR